MSPNATKQIEGSRSRKRSVDDFNKFREYKRKRSLSTSGSRSKSESNSSSKSGSRNRRRSRSRKSSRTSRNRIRQARKSTDNPRMWIWIAIGGAVFLGLLIAGICWIRNRDSGEEKLLKGESKTRCWEWVHRDTEEAAARKRKDDWWRKHRAAKRRDDARAAAQANDSSDKGDWFESLKRTCRDAAPVVKQIAGLAIGLGLFYLVLEKCRTSWPGKTIEDIEKSYCSDGCSNPMVKCMQKTPMDDLKRIAKHRNEVLNGDLYYKVCNVKLRKPIPFIAPAGNPSRKRKCFLQRDAEGNPVIVDGIAQQICTK